MRSLRERRQRLGLTAAVVAHRAKVPPQYIYNAERGIGAIRIRRKIRLVLIDAELWERKARHEASRIARQREVFAALPDGAPKDRLKALLLDAAWQMLDRGSCEEADMVLEIIPEADATRLLDEFFFGELGA